ncbi:uncharacterized protein LOC111334006 [Stylophora pistillata]|uniref:uncharacterized protein LOC111334006 n=1 Tax=Stylophora pistillata TaxID=50429 RepID=UPI000C03A5E8|nr:uncharacterized protein LOC111334006 [Stylophora pistillata]
MSEESSISDVRAETDNLFVSVPFEVKEWDEKANLSPHHLSYIITILLPKRLVTLERDIDIESQLKAFCEKNHINNAIPIGSSTEGFSIPYSMSYEVDSHLGAYVDADVLFVENDFQISMIDPIQDVDTQAILESDDVHPGYGRVRLLQHSPEDLKDVVTHNDKKYLSGQRIQNSAHKKMTRGRSEDDQTSIGLHGPAVSVEYSTVLNADNIQTYGVRIPLDMVYAVQVKQWPPEATQWVQRVKRGNWLGDDLIESIVSEGCYVVPVAHKHSLNPDIEWRISFAVTEKRIAQNAVTDAQRQCYIYFKMLRHLCLKDLEVISSYCLKTVLFHACEVIPKPTWETHTGQCFLYLVDSLISCVKQRNIPSFFMPSNNLVDDVPEEKWGEVESRLLEIRKDPITPILKFTDTNAVSNTEIPFVFRKNIAFVLEDMEKFKVHRDIRRSAFDAFFTTSFRMSLLYLNQGKPNKAVQILIDSYPTLDHFLGPMPLVYFLNEAAILIQDGRLYLLLLQELLGMANQHPDFKLLEGNLACAYHAASYTYPEESSKRAEYLKKAEELVREDVKSQSSSSCGTQVTFATILMSQKKYKEAIEILETVVNAANKSAQEEIQSDMTEFGFSEQKVLDEDLQSEISTHMKIEGPSLIFVFYFLVTCLVLEDEVTKLKTIFEEYQKVCDLCDDITGYKLLGYSFYQVGDKKKARDAFTSALQKMPGSKLLLSNIQKCSE